MGLPAHYTSYVRTSTYMLGAVVPGLQESRHVKASGTGGYVVARSRPAANEVSYAIGDRGTMTLFLQLEAMKG